MGTYGTYIIRRIVVGLILAVLASSSTFFIMRLLPGDPIVLYVAVNQGTITEDARSQLHRKYGLDRPLIVQYFRWINDVAHGRFGQSIYYREDVGILLKERIPVTLYLGLLALIVSTVSGVGLGIAAAIRRGKWIDKLITGVVNGAIAIPVFWLAILLIYLFGLKLRLIPIGGYTSPFDDLWMNLRQSILPVVCLSVPGAAVIARQMRASLLEILRQDYIRTAWAKGLMEGRVLFHHALKNSLIPIISIVGASLGMILGGAVIIETIFAIPGMGRLMISSILAKDYVVIQSGTLIIGLMVIMCNILVDIAYCWCDPRIRYD